MPAPEIDHHFQIREENIETLHFLLNAISDGLVWLDADRKIRHVNPQARRMLGHNLADASSSAFAEILAETGANFRILDDLFAGELIVTDRFVLQHKNGQQRQFILTAIPVTRNAKINGAILVFRDISLGLLNGLPIDQRENLIHEIFGTIPAAFILQNDKGIILRLNHAAAALFGRGIDELLGRQLDAPIFAARDQSGQMIEFENLPFQRVLRGSVRSSEELIRFADPQSVYLMHSRIIEDPDRQQGASRWIFTTIAALDHKTPQPFYESLRFNHTVNHILTDLLSAESQEAITEKALAGVATMIPADLAILHCFGTAEQDAQTWTHQQNQSPGPAKPVPVAADLTNMLATQKDLDQSRLWASDQPDLWVPGWPPCHVLYAPLFQDQNQASGYLLLLARERYQTRDLERSATAVAVLSAALHKREYHERLTKLAMTDSLTGLHNRYAMTTILDQEIGRARRYTHPLSALLLDLDHFKAINDTHGHLAGDAVLVEVAARMRLLIRKTDALARIGGEEFLVLLPESSLAGAAIVAEKIRAAVAEQPIPYEDSGIPVTLSIGVGRLHPGEDKDSLLKRLDALLYKSKQAGRNRATLEE
ncbi:MAG: diguanylate cyclase [Leptospiraceae bacterium]|nr:diguanylate cyclase [Leptospiraceae bacterium]